LNAAVYPPNRNITAGVSESEVGSCAIVIVDVIGDETGSCDGHLPLLLLLLLLQLL